MPRVSTHGVSLPCGNRDGLPSVAGRSLPIPTSSSGQAHSFAELEALATEGVQSLLLEGGPTLATAFVDADLVDKLLVFVAPTLAGDGLRFLDRLSASRALSHLSARQVGEDVLLEAYLHTP